QGWSLLESRQPFTLLEAYAFTTGGVCEQTFITANTLGFFSDDGVYASPRAGGDYERILPRSQAGPYEAMAGVHGLLGARDTGFTLFTLDDPTGPTAVVELPWTQNFEASPVYWPLALHPDGTQLVRRGEA